MNFFIFFTFISILVPHFGQTLPGPPPSTSEIKFEAYTLPPPRQLEGPLARNSILDKAEAMRLDRPISGPESIAIRKSSDDDGAEEIFTGILGGDLIKIKNGKVTKVAKFGQECDGDWDLKTCGRIGGVRFGPDGFLLAADTSYGIFRVDVDKGAVEKLVSMDQKINGKVPKLPNDLDVSKDGTVYWSDSTTNGDANRMLVEILGGPSGRLLKYDPRTKKNSVLLDGVHFANGVQLSEEEDFVLVSELLSARVLRYYLKGEKEGTNDIFVDRLPGYPDNIRPNGKGGFYIVLGSPRIEGELDPIGLLTPYPHIRRFLIESSSVLASALGYFSDYIPSPWFRHGVIQVGNLGLNLDQTSPKVIIVETDRNGTVIGSFQNDKGPIARVTQMSLGKEYAYFGSFSAKTIYQMKISELGRSQKR